MQFQLPLGYCVVVAAAASDHPLLYVLLLLLLQYLLLMMMMLMLDQYPGQNKRLQRHIGRINGLTLGNTQTPGDVVPLRKIPKLCSGGNDQVCRLLPSPCSHDDTPAATSGLLLSASLLLPAV